MCSYFVENISHKTMVESIPKHIKEEVKSEKLEPIVGEETKALAAQKDYNLHQYDAKNAFLHGSLDAIIFTKLPP